MPNDHVDPTFAKLLEEWKRLAMRSVTPMCVFCGNRPQVTPRGGCLECDR